MEKQSIAYMKLCPNCKSIQRVEYDKPTECTICKYPIPPFSETNKEPVKDKEEQPAVHADKVEPEDTLDPIRMGLGGSLTAQEKKKFNKSLRETINQELLQAGFDGNTRFDSPGNALSAATDILNNYGMTLDTVPNSWAMTQYPDHQMTLEVGWQDAEDPFSVYSEDSTLLFFQWHRFDNGKYEVIAYMS